MLANIFGNLTSGIIRLAITAATILLVYLFILKPILETTENVSGSFSSGNEVQKAIDSVNDAFAGEGSESIRRQIEEQLSGAGLGTARANSTAKNPEMRRAQKLLRCVQRSNGDVERMHRCAQRFGP